MKHILRILMTSAIVFVGAPSLAQVGDGNAPVPAQGSINIASTPSGGQVFLDGQDTGKTTPITAYATTVGTHTVRVVSNDLSKTITFQVEAGASLDLTLSLTKTAGATTEAASDASNGVTSAAAAAGDAAVGTAEAAGETAETATEGATGAISETADGAVDAAGDAVDATGEAVGDAADAVSDTAGDAVDAVGDTAGDAADAVSDTASDAVDAVGDTAEATGEAVGDAADAVGEGAADAANALTEKSEDGWSWLSVAGWGSLLIGAMAITAGAVTVTLDSDPLRGPLGLPLLATGAGLGLLGGVLLYLDEELPDLFGDDDAESSPEKASEE